MTHWHDVPDYPIPAEGDAWKRPVYDDLMQVEDLRRVAWNLACALQEIQWEALNLAQDLSAEFEMCDYNYLKEEFRHEESLARQERGVGYMRHAYELAGFSQERRDAIGRIVEQFAAGRDWGK